MIISIVAAVCALGQIGMEIFAAMYTASTCYDIYKCPLYPVGMWPEGGVYNRHLIAKITQHAHVSGQTSRDQHQTNQRTGITANYVLGDTFCVPYEQPLKS